MVTKRAQKNISSRTNLINNRKKTKKCKLSRLLDTLKSEGEQARGRIRERERNLGRWHVLSAIKTKTAPVGLADDQNTAPRVELVVSAMLWHL